MVPEMMMLRKRTTTATTATTVTTGRRRRRTRRARRAMIVRRIRRTRKGRRATATTTEPVPQQLKHCHSYSSLRSNKKIKHGKKGGKIVRLWGRYRTILQLPSSFRFSRVHSSRSSPKMTILSTSRTQPNDDENSDSEHDREYCHGCPDSQKP